MKHIVSVSLGSSKRNKSTEVELLGELCRIERIGTDGSLERFSQMFRDLDGKVDAFGVGGTDIYLVVGKRRYAFRQIQRAVAGARRTPVVDGSGLKHTLERKTIYTLQQQGTVDFAHESALLVSAVDRYGMAQALDELCPRVIYGDLMFGLGLPIPLRSYRAVERLGRLSLPLVTRLPFKWFYPTGEKQEHRTPKFGWAFEQSSVIAGDSLYIYRYAPDRMPGKTVITQSVRERDFAWMRGAGVDRVVTTTPMMGGETFATNVMEAALVALLGKRPEELDEQDYLSALERLNWQPNVVQLSPLAGTVSGMPADAAGAPA